MPSQPPSEHPDGLNVRDFDALLTTDKPIIFTFHGYPSPGRAAYAVGELRGWRIGLEQKPENAKAFYGVIALAFGLGTS